MEGILKYLDEIIRIGTISSKDINIQYLCKVYCRALEQYPMQFESLEKKLVTQEITAFKSFNKWTPVYED